MPQPVTEAFTASVVEHLCEAGIIALVDREVGPGAICVELIPDRVLAFLDLATPPAPSPSTEPACRNSSWAGRT